MDSIFAWRRFLRLHPRGLFTDRARNRLARLRFQRARESKHPAAFRRFLRLHAKHPLAARAWRRLLRLRATRLARRGSRAQLAAFLKRHPKSDHAPALRRRLATLEYRALGEQATTPALEAFLRRHPQSPRRSQVRRRLQERLAERVRRFGGVADIQGFLDRFPSSKHAARLGVRLAHLRWSEAVRSLDPGRLPPPRTDERVPGQSALRSWLERAQRARSSLTPLLRAAAPYRPTARARALLVAARGSHPATAAVALAQLVYRPRLDAFEALLRATASPDPGVAITAVHALQRWRGRAPRREAARWLLEDRLSALEKRNDTGSQLRALALAWTLKDTQRVRTIGSARQWHRPWALVPTQLRLLSLRPDSDSVKAAAGTALEVYRAGVSRLRQMLPKRLGASTRLRAEGIAFELRALARGMERVLGRHGESGPWQRKLQTLADRCRRLSQDVEQRLRARFEDFEAVRLAEIQKRARAHAARRAPATARLVLRLRRAGAPDALFHLLCQWRIRLPGRCGGT